MRRKHPPASGRLNRRGPVASFAVTFEWGYADSRMGACPDTCGWRRTCPPKPRYATPARRSASLKRGSARRDGARRFRFSHPAERRSADAVRRKGDGRPHGAPRRPRRTWREGAATPDCRGCGHQPSRSWSARAPSAGPSCPRTTPRRSASCGGSAACSRRSTSTAAARIARRRRPRCRPPRGDCPARWRRRRRVVIVKKVGTSKTAAPKSKASNVRALIDYIAGVATGGDGEKVEHRGAVNLLNIDHDGQVQEMVDLAEVARRSPQPVQHWILSWREGEQPTRVQARRGRRDVPRRDGPWRAPSHLCASPRHPQLPRPPRYQPRPPHDGEGRHRQQRLRPRNSPSRDRSHRAESGVGARGAWSLRGGHRWSRRAAQASGAERTAAVRSCPGPRGAHGPTQCRADCDRGSRNDHPEGAKLARATHRTRRPGDAIREEGFRRTDLDRRPAGQGEHRRPRLLDGGSARPARRLRDGVAGAGRRVYSPASRRRIRAHTARLPRRTTRALPRTRRQTGASNPRAKRGMARSRRPPPEGTGRHLPRFMAGQGRPLERDTQRARRTPGPGEGGGSGASAIWSGRPSAESSGGFLLTRTGSPAAIAIGRTDGGTALGGPPPSRARPSRSPRRGTFAPSPLSLAAGRSITISRDRGAPPSRTTGRRSTFMPAETARASWRPWSSARRSGGPFRCMATENSCASVSSWPPSTASGSPIPTFKSRLRPSANGTGDKTRPTSRAGRGVSSGVSDARFNLQTAHRRASA